MGTPHVLSWIQRDRRVHLAVPAAHSPASLFYLLPDSVEQYPRGYMYACPSPCVQDVHCSCPGRRAFQVLSTQETPHWGHRPRGNVAGSHPPPPRRSRTATRSSEGSWTACKSRARNGIDEKIGFRRFMPRSGVWVNHRFGAWNGVWEWYRGTGPCQNQGTRRLGARLGRHGSLVGRRRCGT